MGNSIFSWLQDLKNSESTLLEIATKFEMSFTETGFNETEQLTVLEKELQKIETNLKTALNQNTQC